MAGSKLGFSRAIRGQLRVKLGQTRSKLPKISKKLRFDVKLWKVMFCEGFDLVWPSVNLRLAKGISVILAKKVLCVL